MTRNWLLLGLLLWLGFYVQSLFGPQWVWLESIQKENTYRLVTGSFLALFLLSQWFLAILRMKSSHKLAKSNFLFHQKMGVLAPIFYFIHTVHLGFGYLFVLSTVYFTNLLVGLANPNQIGLKRAWYKKTWLPTHVALSVLTILIMLLHIGVILVFE